MDDILYIVIYHPFLFYILLYLSIIEQRYNISDLFKHDIIFWLPAIYKRMVDKLRVFSSGEIDFL